MEEKHKKLMIEFFQKEADVYWKTIDEIVRGTNLPHATVLSILSSSGDFVRSSYRQKAGQPLYTTRDIFRNKAPFVDKMIGAFKNRID